MTGIRLELGGDEAVLSGLGTAVEGLSNARALWDEVGLALTTSTQMRFERGEAPDGSPWPPSIRVLAQGGKTLILSGRLAASISYEASDSGVAVGSNVLYAAIHQLGGTIHAKTPRGLHFRVAGPKGSNKDGQWVNKQSVTLPARPFLGLDDDDNAELLAIATDWLARVTDATPEARP